MSLKVIDKVFDKYRPLIARCAKQGVTLKMDRPEFFDQEASRILEIATELKHDMGFKQGIELYIDGHIECDDERRRAIGAAPMFVSSKAEVVVDSKIIWRGEDVMRALLAHELGHLKDAKTRTFIRFPAILGVVALFHIGFAQMIGSATGAVRALFTLAGSIIGAGLFMLVRTKFYHDSEYTAHKYEVEYVGHEASLKKLEKVAISHPEDHGFESDYLSFLRESRSDSNLTHPSTLKQMDKTKSLPYSRGEITRMALEPTLARNIKKSSSHVQRIDEKEKSEAPVIDR